MKPKTKTPAAPQATAPATATGPAPAPHAGTDDQNPPAVAVETWPAAGHAQDAARIARTVVFIFTPRRNGR